MRRAGALAATLAVVAAGACEPGVPELSFEVLETLPHDTSSYTQGLVYADGALYESTGRYGSSRLRKLDAATGEVLRSVDLPEEYFGEGLARVGNRLVQLTWKEGVVLVWDLDTFELERTVEVPTHGWGLCHADGRLYATTGGTILFVLDDESFEVVDRLEITREGAPLSDVNELECVGPHVWANVYQTTGIVRIDRATGEVDGRIDASSLVPASLRGDTDAVLNGIAYDPASDTFYLTGKLWPVLYRVRLGSGSGREAGERTGK